MSSINRTDGYLLVDNRHAPVPDELLLRAGAPIGMGRMFEGATLHCKHCATVVVKNPDRIRPRTRCKSCNVYVCDQCALAMSQPGYVHRTFDELSNLVQSGLYTLAGSTSAPILIPIGDSTDGQANIPGS
jgi:hypothetical protein